MARRLLFLFTSCMFLVHANGQTAKQLALADQYFASGEYFTAAGLYGQYLNPAVNRSSSGFPLNAKRNSAIPGGHYENQTDILFRQAESYRLSNYFAKAADLYQQCIDKDAHRYADAIYLLAICQRSSGNYKLAEENIDRFLRESPAGSQYQQAAAEEKQRLQFISKQLVRPDSAMYHVQKINTSLGDKGIFAATENGSSQFIFTSTQTDSTSKDNNPYHNRLFTSRYSAGSLADVKPLSIEMNDASGNQAAACVSADGNYLYFTQWNKEEGRVMSSIFYAMKRGDGWSQPVLLSSVNQAGHSSKQPYCTPDGKFIFFASDRTGGRGQFDIWYAPLMPDGTTGVPVNAGDQLNSAGNEQAPFYHAATSTLVFSSDRMPGMGGYDLFMAKGPVSDFGAAENMGYPVNSSRDDVYFFTSGKNNLLDQAWISSDRGSECCLSTYTISKTPKKQMMTGFIRDCHNNESIGEANVVMKDAAGKTMETVTGADGRFSFENTTGFTSLVISKDKYNDKTASVQITGRNESGWFTDTLFQADVCVEKKLVIKMEDVVTVYFDYDDARLKNVVVAKLDSIYQVLAKDSLITIQISGYSDGKGTVAYNKKLSDRRAKACTEYLIKKGIAARRISFASFGACCPVEMEQINGRDNGDARSLNRRALIHISKE